MAAREKFLAENNSAFDAAIDFRFFTDSCFKTCQNKTEHFKTDQEINYENI